MRQGEEHFTELFAYSLTPVFTVFTHKMSTSPHTKNPWHWKQTKQVMRDYFRILLRSVKFNSGLRWKAWPRASFRAHTVQLATLRQDTSSRRAAGIQAHCPAVDSQHSSALKWPMLLADLRAKGHCQTPSERDLISSHLQEMSPWQSFPLRTARGGFLHKTQHWHPQHRSTERRPRLPNGTPHPLTTAPLTWTLFSVKHHPYRAPGPSSQNTSCSASYPFHQRDYTSPRTDPLKVITVM